MALSPAKRCPDAGVALSEQINSLRKQWHSGCATLCFGLITGVESMHALMPPEIILRLIVAAVLAGVVGLERERLAWVAGLRTHMLVGLGAALIMIVSAYGFTDVLGAPNVILDPSRIAAQVVSGIGFLGAGTILFLRQEVIRGLTTAASLWAVAAVGLAVGGGLYVAAVCTTVLMVTILAIVKPLERRLFRRNQSRQVTVQFDRQRVSLQQIEFTLEKAGLGVKEFKLTRGDAQAGDHVQFTLLRGVSKDAVMQLTAKLQDIEGVSGITLQN
jgi:putative Mg2+ transporter-C (MgtC) family protein